MVIKDADQEVFQESARLHVPSGEGLEATTREEDNVEWFARQVQELEKALPALTQAAQSRQADGDADGDQMSRYPEDPTHVLLFGGRTAHDFRLRVAQSSFLHEVSPSNWSHAAIVKSWNAEQPARSVLLEVSLEPRLGFGMPVTHNGLQTNYLDWYTDPVRYPNVAILQVPVSRSRWELRSTPLQTSPLERFAMQRRYLDVPALVLRWLGYVWSVGDEANPLLDGAGIPSATAIEALLDAAGYDISPGLQSGASSPEAMWQAASWWHPFYEEHAIDPIHGYYTHPHRLDYVASQFQPGPEDRDLWLDPLDLPPKKYGMDFR